MIDFMENAVPCAASFIEEANRYHRQSESTKELEQGQICPRLLAVWMAGEALIKAKALAGHGNWEAFVENHFEGSSASAKRYMQIRKSLIEMSDLIGRTLNAAYLEFGMISTNNSPSKQTRLAPPGAHLYLAQQLAAHIRRVADSNDTLQKAQLKVDLEVLKKEMDRL